ARPVGKARSAKVGLGEFVVLDHRAHGAVEQQDSFLCCGTNSAGGLFASISTRHSGGPLQKFWPKPEEMPNRKYKIGAVHRVKMKFLNSMIDEIEHLLGGNGRGDKFSRLRIVVEPLKPLGEPLRHFCPSALREFRCLLEILYRHDARGNRNIDS